MRIEDEVDGIGAMLAGVANVIMQLSQPPVGYGVLESKVESGQITRHPLKRYRTTFTYLSVALMGTEEERATYRRAVGRSHVQVRSGPESPVSYSAFDPELQLWVAACLYRGAVDVHERFRGDMTDEDADAFYLQAARLGTTLQVEPDMWPPDREAFERYWEASLAKVSIDAPVREYLDDLVALRHLPVPLQVVAGGLSRFVTTGFLPPLFREQMHYRWSPRDQARFDRLIGALAFLNGLLPAPLRRFPLNYFLWDMRVRARLGLRLV